jgi:hypothetical protein
MQRGRGDDEIGLREGVAGLAAVLDQQPPLEHDVFGDGEHALVEHRAHFVREPVIELGAAAGVGDQLDAEADFGESHGADEEPIKRLCGNEGQHFWLGFRVREDVVMREMRGTGSIALPEDLPILRPTMV